MLQAPCQLLELTLLVVFEVLDEKRREDGAKSAIGLAPLPISRQSGFVAGSGARDIELFHLGLQRGSVEAKQFSRPGLVPLHLLQYLDDMTPGNVVELIAVFRVC